VPAALGATVDLFLLGRAVRPAALPPGLQRIVPGLAAAGLLIERADDAVQADGVIVLHVDGVWLVCHPPQPDPLFYFGEDSLALLRRLPRSAAGTCLDLCAGTGLHAVYCGLAGGSVIAVERDPRVARLAQLNAELNGVTDRLQVRPGDLYGPVAGLRFDLVTANPPSLPYPADLPGPRIGHGGEDGLRLVTRILDGLPDALTRTGRAYLVSLTLTDGRAGRLDHRLADLVRDRDLGISGSVLSHAPMRAGSTTFERVVAVVAAIAGTDRDRVRHSYARLLDRLDASHLSAFALRITAGGGGLPLMDVSSPDQESLWHV
jgi:hypothetical protein